MGEKPMGTPVDDEELGPEAGAGAINTTRSGIKNTPAVADAGGAGTEGGEPPAGGESAGTTINTTRDNIKHGVAGPGGGAGVTGDPIPGIDTK